MTTQTDTPPDTDSVKPDSKSGWKRRVNRPNVTLPSGAVVTIKLPNIAQLIKSGTLPNDLIEAAIEVRSADKITRQMLEESWNYTEFIVPLTVADPAIEAEDVKDLPPDDLEMLVGFAGRQIDTDAIGHHISGLEANAAWRKFRGRQSFDEIATGL